MEFNKLINLGNENNDRRQFERRRLIIEIAYQGGEATGIASTRDIGFGGLFLTTKKSFQTGEVLMLKMTLGGEEPQTVVIKGLVTYVEPDTGIGIRFQNLKPEVEELLKKELEIN